MINGITSEFGEVIFDGARVPATDMIGAPGEGWKLAMTVVSHERQPGELGYVARYKKLVKDPAQPRRQPHPGATGTVSERSERTMSTRTTARRADLSLRASRRVRQ
jgi:alkylation response protein AidB-like acyl-CoA dehydrogenase